MNLASFAELAVRLVNSAAVDASTDPLRSSEAVCDWVADRPFLAVPATRQDLARLRLLRAELAAIFGLAAGGAGAAAVERLNALMMIHPVHPVIVSHDGEPWHLHLTESGSLTDRYAAAAVISLSLLVGQLGIERLGVCAIASCDRVFIDGSSNRSRRYCAGHSPARANVTSLRHQRHGTSSGTAESVASAAS